jgi:hypothetical protein
MVADAWERNNYPRLVRRTPHPEELPALDEDVLPGLLRLRLGLGSEAKFRRAVADFASNHSPEGYTSAENSLESWTRLVRDIGFYMDLLEFLDHLEQASGLEYASGSFQKQLETWLAERESEVGGLPAHAWVLRRAIADDKSPLEESMFPGKTPSDLRRLVSGIAWEQFQAQSTGSSAIGPPGLVTVACGVRGWAFKCLWEATTGGEVRKCGGCGIPFVAARPNQKYCPKTSSACRAKAFRHRKRVS